MIFENSNFCFVFFWKNIYLGGAAICTPIASSSILTICDFFAPGLARIINFIFDADDESINWTIDFGITDIIEWNSSWKKHSNSNHSNQLVVCMEIPYIHKRWQHWFQFFFKIEIILVHRSFNLAIFLIDFFLNWKKSTCIIYVISKKWWNESAKQGQKKLVSGIGKTSQTKKLSTKDIRFFWKIWWWWTQ